MKRWMWVWMVGVMVGLAGCGGAATVSPAGEGDASAESLQVVATTTLVGDVVRQVAGEAVTVTVLMPVGADPHTFTATPQDVALLAGADLVFVNGFEFEEGLMPLIESNVAPEKIIAVSAGIEPLEGEEHAEGEEDSHEAGDPHTWWDVANVMVWVANVRNGLNAADPANAEMYTANGAAYMAELEALDAWVAEEVAKIPADKRVLVTDHDTMSYFAARYGFEVVGAVIPGSSTSAQPSAQELAALQTLIAAEGVSAVFVGTTVNPQLAEQVAADAGIEIVSLYTDSLSAVDGPASSYIAFMRRNIASIVTALQ